MFLAKGVKYDLVLALDKKIRLFPPVPHLQVPQGIPEVDTSFSAYPILAMQQFCVLLQREISKRCHCIWSYSP